MEKLEVKTVYVMDFLFDWLFLTELNYLREGWTDGITGLGPHAIKACGEYHPKKLKEQGQPLDERTEKNFNQDISRHKNMLEKIRTKLRQSK